MPGADQTIRLAENVMSREVGGETVLLDLDSETYFGLDEVGTDLLRELESGCTFDQAVDALLERWEIDRETLAADVSELVELLVENGLVEISEHAE